MDPELFVGPELEVSDLDLGQSLKLDGKMPKKPTKNELIS
jgi:hypothetical protein